MASLSSVLFISLNVFLAQLGSYDFFKRQFSSVDPWRDEKLLSIEDNVKSLHIQFTASLASGLLVTTFINPFDTISTRLYSQGGSSKGAVVYSNGLECAVQMFKT